MFSSGKKITACIAAICLMLTVFACALPSARVADSVMQTQGVVDIEQMQAPAADSGMTSYQATATVTGTTVNVRSGPSTAYGKIGTVGKNTKVTVVGKFSNGWYKIQYGSGYGYMSGDYLTNFQTTGSADKNMTAFSATANTTETLNVRSGPSTSYSKIGSLSKGAKVIIVGKFSSGWYKIQYGSGFGYVSGSYLKNIISGGTTTPDKDYIATGVTTDNLNVRTGRGTSYSKLGVIPKGTTVKIVENKVAGWYKIQYGSGFGYVSADYIKNYTPAEPTTTLPTTTATTTLPTTAEITVPTTVTTTEKTTVTTTAPDLGNGEVAFNASGITTDNLNVRTGPGTSYTRLGTIPKGTVISIIANLPKEKWYKIQYGSKIGYVSSMYVGSVKEIEVTTTETTEQPPVVDPEKDGDMTVFNGTGVTTDALNVRKGPTTAYSKLGVVAAGTRLDLVGFFPSTNWYKVVYGGGYGYVCGDYLKNVVGENGLPPITGEAKIAQIVSKKAVIYPLNPTASTIYSEMSPKNNHLPVGAQDYVTGEFTKYSKRFYQLASGISILQDDAVVKNGEAFGENSVSVLGTSTGGATVITLSTDWNVPMRVTLTPQFYTTSDRSEYGFNVSELTAEYMEIKFPYTTSASGTPDVSGSSVISSAEWVKTQDSTYTLRLKLRNKGSFFGYDLAYNDGKAIISVREVAKPQSADNEYGYSLNGVRVWLDPGHGANDSGAIGYIKGVYEKDLNLKLACIIKEQLEALGATVGITRTTDVFYSLDDRVSMAENFDADIFISVHHDYAASTGTNGTSAHYFTPFSSELGKSIHKEIVSAYANSVYTENTSQAKNNLSRIDRGNVQNVFVVNRVTDFPSVLIEYGFVSNPLEVSKLIREDVQTELAKSTVRGIIAYLNSK